MDLALAAFATVGPLLVFVDFRVLACAESNKVFARMPMASSVSLVKFIIVPVWDGERDREGGVRTVKKRITIFVKRVAPTRSRVQALSQGNSTAV